MFDSIDGIALNDAARQWDVSRSSTFVGEVTAEVAAVRVPGRHGYRPAGPSVDDAPAVLIGVITSEVNAEMLRALMHRPQPLLGDSTLGRTARAQLTSITPKRILRHRQKWVEYVATYEIPGVYSRSAAEATVSAALSANTVQLDVFPGISGYVDDAIVRVKGAASTVQVTDSAGSWFRYTALIPAGSYLRFHADTGEAFMTSTDTWTGGADVTASIENGPGPYPLLITPTAGDPAQRRGRLTITSSNRASSPTVDVRGRSAHLV